MQESGFEEETEDTGGEVMNGAGWGGAECGGGEMGGFQGETEIGI